MGYRTERDILGSVRVPSSAYYGSETQRAIDNFKVSGMHVPGDFIRAYAMLKKGAALANMKIRKLDRKIGNAIVRASDEVMNGKLSDQFTLDVFQAGAGTSTNMNLNEVIANRALELIGKRRGDYRSINPNDHVNMSQSTNDTFHSVIHISTDLAVKSELIPALSLLEGTLKRKSAEFRNIVKIGRTHLQDAVPMTLGQEFSGYAGLVGDMADNILYAYGLMQKIPIGGTAIGTGINAPKGYSAEAARQISKIAGIKFTTEKNLFAGYNQKEELVMAAMLKSTAVSLNKIANDLRLLASGPRAGISEITLPAVQPGSSIMPGKVNPSMAEMLNMVCFQAIGSCTAIEEAAAGGQLELNVFMPLIAYDLLFTVKTLSSAIRAFNDRCVSGIRPMKARIERILNEDLSVVTALSPYIGYAKAAEIAKRAYDQNKTIKEVCMQMKVLDRKTLDRLLDPRNQV